MQIPKDSTDRTTYFTLRDSTTHAPKTDVTITDIDIYYVPYRGAISAKVDLTALDAADSAHADNKGYNVGKGSYRIDWPDIWTGAVGTVVNLIVECTGVDTEYLECEIVGVGQTGDVYAKLPTNFEDMAITNTTGLVDVNDKGGFSLAATGADLILKSSTFIQAIVAAINELATYGLTAINTLLVTTGIKAASVPNVTLANGAHGGAATVITLQTPIEANVASETNHDFTALQKTSLNAATPVVTLTEGQAMTGTKVVYDKDADTIKVYDSGNNLLNTYTKTSVGNVHTLTRT